MTTTQYLFNETFCNFFTLNRLKKYSRKEILLHLIDLSVVKKMKIKLINTNEYLPDSLLEIDDILFTFSSDITIFLNWIICKYYSNISHKEYFTEDLLEAIITSMIILPQFATFKYYKEFRPKKVKSIIITNDML